MTNRRRRKTLRIVNSIFKHLTFEEFAKKMREQYEKRYPFEFHELTWDWFRKKDVIQEWLSRGRSKNEIPKDF